MKGILRIGYLDLIFSRFVVRLFYINHPVSGILLRVHKTHQDSMESLLNQKFKNKSKNKDLLGRKSPLHSQVLI